MIAWFMGTKVGKWLAVALALLAAVATEWIVARHRGAKAQAATDAEAQAAEQIAAAKAAQQTYTDASEAAAKVQQVAQAQPAPDTAGRTDFDNTF